MAVLRVPTNFNIDLEFEIPEFYRRMFSLLIDVLIEYFYLRIAIEIFSEIAQSLDIDDGFNIKIAVIAMLFFLPILTYHLVLEIFLNGQSIGKKIMRLRVVDERGGRPGISQFLIRWLLRVSDGWLPFVIIFMASGEWLRRGPEFALTILLAMAFLITDIILIVSSKKGQRIGDILARTIVIRINTKSDIEDTVFQEVADNYVPVFPEIMKLGDKDINAIKSILDTARKKGDFNLAANAADKIKNHLNIKTALSPFDFLDTAMKDYNYLSTK
jgi:uncharacterized RDD family membrane protein YckC